MRKWHFPFIWICNLLTFSEWIFHSLREMWMMYLIIYFTITVNMSLSHLTSDLMLLNLRWGGKNNLWMCLKSTTKKLFTFLSYSSGICTVVWNTVVKNKNNIELRIQSSDPTYYYVTSDKSLNFPYL